VYNSKKINALGIRQKLKILDEMCKENSVDAEFIIVGGAALNLIMDKNKMEPRGTIDIDVSGFTTNKEEKLMEMFKLLDIESVGGVLLPDNMEIMDSKEYEELDDDYSKISVYFVTVEMFICIKALTKRPRDRDDILNEDILSLCDPQKTINLIVEYLSFHTNPDDPDLNTNDILPILEKMV